MLLETGLWLSVIGQNVDTAAVDVPGSVMPEGVSERTDEGELVAHESVLAKPMSTA